MNTYHIESVVSKIGINVLETRLLKRGNWKKHDYNTDGLSPSLLFVDDEFIIKMPELYSIKSTIKNLIDENKKSITNKDNLYVNLNKKYPNICEKYMMKQYQINNKNYKEIPKNIFENKIWIIKPVRGFQGRNNLVLTNYNDYMKYINTHMNTKVSKFGYVLDEYITDPLLLFGYKFHFRGYYVYYNNSGYYFNKFITALAKEPYISNDYNNIKIHDTHGASISGIFPDDYSNIFGDEIIKNITLQIKEIMYHITKLLKPTCYPESKNCFEMFGVDLMITEDYNVKLLEVNEKIGYDIDYLNIRGISFYIEMYEGICSNIIDNIIKPKNDVPKNYYYTKL